MARILVSGAGGFVGSPLVKLFKDRGDEVVALTRGASRDGAIHWNPAAGEIDADALDGFDSVVHLAGEPIAGLWTKGKKRAIIESRRDGTRLLADAVASLDSKPESFVSASAIGIYGSRGE